MLFVELSIISAAMYMLTTLLILTILLRSKIRQIFDDVVPTPITVAILIATVLGFFATTFDIYGYYPPAVLKAAEAIWQTRQLSDAFVFILIATLLNRRLNAGEKS